MTDSTTISVIIPALNEQDQIAESIRAANSASVDEIIVSVGRSSDGTARIAKQHGCVVVQSKTGRAIQQNAGAARATGDIILFVHADNRLPPNACNQILSSMVDPGFVWGAFRQRIDSDRSIYRWIERGNAARVRFRSMAFGDQGIFLRRELFESLGGFPNVSLMEDVLMSQNLRKISRPILLPGPIQVSDRRWESRGVIRQTLSNWKTMLRFKMGVSPDKLAQDYLPQNEL